MPEVAWGSFVPATVALIPLPGPDTVCVLGRAVEAGRRAGIATAAGVAVGVLGHASVAALGLAVVVRGSPRAVRAIEVGGAAFLVYLGVTTLWSDGVDVGDAGAGAGAGAGGGGLVRSFARGLVVNASNPEVALFFLAFLPRFVDGAPAAGIVALGGVYAVLTAAYLGGIAAVSATATRLLAADGVERLLRAGAATLLVALGVRLAVETVA